MRDYFHQRSPVDMPPLDHDAESLIDAFSAYLPGYRHHYLNRPASELSIRLDSTSGQEWDLEAVVRDLAPRILRMKDQRHPDRPEEKQGLHQLFLGLEDHVYITISHDHLSILAPTPASAESQAQWFEKTYRRQRSDAATTALFHLIGVDREFGSNGWHTVTVPVPATGLRDSADLTLHYGDDAETWLQGWQEDVARRPSGLTLFRGAPGTGKTTFIRHLVERFGGKFRFYLLPSGQDAMLSRQDTINFWVSETRCCRLPKVAVLEDAEALLTPRDRSSGDSVSNLLNATDGLLGDFLKVHILATVNCRLSALDPACIRPGRLIQVREFDSLPRAQAERVAARHSLPPLSPGPKDFTLAEIFHAAAMTPPHLGFPKSPQSRNP